MRRLNPPERGIWELVGPILDPHRKIVLASIAASLASPLLDLAGRGRIKTIFSLRNHLHYVPGALLPLWTLSLILVAAGDVASGSSTALPWGVLIFWGACRLSKLAERWISLNAAGSRRLSDLIRSLAVENALKFTKLQATITALSGRRMKWRRTPKFKHTGRILRRFQSATHEVLTGLRFIAAAIALLYVARPEGVTLAIYAALRRRRWGGAIA